LLESLFRQQHLHGHKIKLHQKSIATSFRIQSEAGMSEPPTSQPPVFDFKRHPSTLPFSVSPQTYSSTHRGKNYRYIASALVFDNETWMGPRVLLIQRSARDAMPNLWEVPGGSVDDDDKSILHAVARELWEEAGLTATKIGRLVGAPQIFAARPGKEFCKFTFLVEVEQSSSEGLKVKLDPMEHQKFVWATEEEVRAGKVGNVELEFTSWEVEQTVLEAFRARKEVSLKQNQTLVMVLTKWATGLVKLSQQTLYEIIAW
jgi:8-oxo-dGTP pyrophosphatase MutT (NUDIX family)